MTGHPQKRIKLLAKGDAIGARLFNELIKTCNALRTLRVKSGAKNDFVISDDNAELTIAPTSDDSESPPSSVSCYRLKSVAPDYLTCRLWNGSTDGDTDIYIAKVHKLRNGITAETLEGITYYYTYAAGPDSENVYRNAHTGSSGGPIVETCVVTPEWIVNDLIYGISCDTFVATADSILMLGDGRAWSVHA